MFKHHEKRPRLVFKKCQRHKAQRKRKQKIATITTTAAKRLHLRTQTKNGMDRKCT